MAVSHSMLKAIYHMLKKHTRFNDLTAEHYKQSVNEATAKRALVRSLERMGVHGHISSQGGRVSGVFSEQTSQYCELAFQTQVIFLSKSLSKSNHITYI